MRTNSAKAPPVRKSTMIEVYLAAGGSCSFPGCYENVLQERLTKQKSALGHVAHIAAESTEGPRGDDPLPLVERSKSHNLMLMCMPHHAFIDKPENVSRYSSDALRRMKREHEARIAQRSAVPLDATTYALRLIGRVRGHRVSISEADVWAAITKHEKRYISDSVIDIDLGDLPDTGDAAYWAIGKAKVDAVLNERVFPLAESGKLTRISIFGLARIPLLAYLGHRLGDKLQVALYHKHRDTEEGWSWPDDGREVRFEIVPHGHGAASRVGVLACVSGGAIENVRRSSGPEVVYEIRPIGELPRRTLVTSPATVANFRTVYQELLSMIEARHGKPAGLDYYLAVPPPMAVVCGRDVLRDVVPPIVVHDWTDDGYAPALTLA